MHMTNMVNAGERELPGQITSPGVEPGQREMETMDGGQRDGVVTLQQVAVRLGERTVWREANLDIGAGEFVAVLGPNGAGKTTLLRLLLGLVRPLEGRVEIGRA